MRGFTGKKLQNAAAVALMLAASAVCAQQKPAAPGDFPKKPVRIVVGNAPGGGSDITARALAQKLTELWNGNAVVVENRAGGNGVIAFNDVAKATPDGTLLLVASSSSLASNAAQRKLGFDLRKEYDPISQLTEQNLVLVAIPSLPANTLGEVIALAKSKPGTLNMASSGPGSIAHAGLELLNVAAGIDITHVPYKGIGPALTAMLGGEVQLALATSVSSVSFIKAGKLKAIASAGARRERALPDLPTFTEAGVPLDLGDWFGSYTTGGTPVPILLALHRDIVRAMASPDLQARLGGAEAVTSATPAEAKQKISGEITKWEKLIQIPRFAASLQ